MTDVTNLWLFMCDEGEKAVVYPLCGGICPHRLVLHPQHRGK